MVVCPTGTTGLIPKADASGEGVAVPEDTNLAGGDSTAPIAVNHCEQVRLYMETTSASYAGAAIEWQYRADRDGAWATLATDNPSANGVVSRALNPNDYAQIRAVITSIDDVVIKALGQVHEAR